MLSKPRALGALGSFRAARAVRAALLGMLTFAIAGIAYPVDARITGLQITSVQSPAFGGASFGNAGQYETLVGTASGEVDPADPLNAIITDIELAPRNARGMVEYSMDVVITKPIDTSRGNGTLLHDVPNRGRIRSPELNVGGNATTIGDGFLESQGYTLVDSGWEGDLTTGLRSRCRLPGITTARRSPVRFAPSTSSMNRPRRRTLRLHPPTNPPVRAMPVRR